MPNGMTGAVVMGRTGLFKEEGIKLVGGCWVVDDWMEGASCVIEVGWFIVDDMGAWEAKDGLMSDEMTGAVYMGREVLTFVGVEVMFENIKINTEDQYATCLAA